MTPYVHVLVSLVAMGCASSLDRLYAAPARERLDVIVAVVARDLSVRPVPKFPLWVIRDGQAPTEPPVADLVTGFDGKATAHLEPGRYRIVATEPLAFEDATLSWDLPFEIAPGAAAVLELSSDNATRSATGPRSPAATAASVFEQARASVVVVETENGHGSGFLVDATGLIVTNDHVLGKTRYVAVKTDKQHKYAAVIVARDRDHDVGIVRVHPQAIATALPLPLASSDTDVTVGEQVVAIGSPLTVRGPILTTGVVSRVEAETIASDVNINPGNSGGPLLNLRREVIGITTFSQQSAVGGPGIAGIVRVGTAAKIIEEARAAAKATEPPPFEQLAVAPSTGYPIAALRSLVHAKPDLKKYHLEAGDIDIDIATPPLLYYLQNEAAIKATEARRKRSKGNPVSPEGEEVYEWQAAAGAWDAVVTIRAMPEVTMTGGSKAGRAFGALLGVVTPANYRFKTDFREMKLLRDGVEVRPIVPGRVCQTVEEQAGLNRLRDIGCLGVYQYAPDAFAPGAALELRVFAEDAPAAPKVLKLMPTLVETVWADFKPYFESLR